MAAERVGHTVPVIGFWDGDRSVEANLSRIGPDPLNEPTLNVLGSLVKYLNQGRSTMTAFSIESLARYDGQ